MYGAGSQQRTPALFHEITASYSIVNCNFNLTSTATLQQLNILSRKQMNFQKKCEIGISRTQFFVRLQTFVQKFYPQTEIWSKIKSNMAAAAVTKFTSGVGLDHAV